LFDKAGDVLTDEEIEALGNRMAAEKARKQGQPVPKEAKPAQSGEKGIIAKIKDFVGLGNSSENQKPAKKKAAKKAPVKKAPVKKAPVKKAAVKKAPAKKAPAKKAAAKKKAGVAKGSKKTGTTARKRSAAT